MERTNERGTSVSSTSTQQSNNSTTQYHNQQQHHHNIQPQHNLSVTTLSSLGERVNPSSTGVSSTAMSSSVGVGGGGQGSGPASLDSISSTMGGIANSSGGTERTRDLALCAVLLDEWLKELAAIAQEQSVVMINIGY